MKEEDAGCDPGALLSHIRNLEGAAGDSRERLFSLVYDELRSMAGRLMREERPNHTLQPTALVHEVFIRLVDGEVDWESRAHFFGIAARAMRQVLVDYARQKGARKRGGNLTRITLTEGLPDDAALACEVVDLDRALSRLEEQDPRMARVAELRAFAGMTNLEAAKVLGVSRRTVVAEWSVARLWLTRELGGATT